MAICACLPCKEATKGEVFKDAKDRRCTDILCLLLLIAGVGLSIALCVVSVAAQPNLILDLIYPTDYFGNNCGYTDGFKDKKKLVYPRLDQDFVEGNNALYVSTGQWWNFKPYGLCTEDCPSGIDLGDPTLYGGPTYATNQGNTTADAYYYTYLTTDMLGRCLPTAASAPGEERYLCAKPFCTDVNMPCTVVDSQPGVATTWEVCPTGTNSTECARQEALCTGLKVKESVTETFTPSTQTADDYGFTRNYATYVQLVVGGYEGLVVTEGIIALTVFGVALPIVMGFVWAIFLWFFAGIIVYVLIVALILVLLILDFVLMIKAGFFTIDESVTSAIGIDYNATSVLSTADETWKTWFMVLAIISLICTALFAIFIIANRKCIGRLIAILQEVTKVFRSMFCIMWWPFWDLGLQGLTFVFGFFCLFFTVNDESTFSEAGWRVLAVLYQVLVIFWLSQFFRATIWTSMSAAISRWYVTDNAAGAYKPCCGIGSGLAQLGSGTCLVVSKHLGTMAFGALIIAIVQTIRAVVQFIDYYTQDAQKKNCLLSLCIKCIQYVLACIQKTIEMITYYGFVFTAMQGDPFCKACYETMAFIIQYPAQTALNKTVTFILFLLIGVSTPVLSAACAFWYLEYGAGDYPDKFNTLWAAGLAFVFAYIVTQAIVSIYNCAMDTIYLCAFKDMAENDPPKYMSNDLRTGFGLALSAHDAFVEAGAPPELAAKHKSQTQRRREKKDYGKAEGASGADVSAVSATSGV